MSGVGDVQEYQGHGSGELPQKSSAHEALSRPDVLLEVLCRLASLPDLVHCCHVCRAWRSAAATDLPWRRLYVRLYGRPEAREACESYRQQFARRAGLRSPRTGTVPGLPVGDLQRYDDMYGIRTLAVSYDPVTRTLLRAVRSRALLGSLRGVAVQGVGLGRELRSHGERQERGGSGAIDPSPASASGAGPPLLLCMLSGDTWQPAPGQDGGLSADLDPGELGQRCGREAGASQAAPRQRSAGGASLEEEGPEGEQGQQAAEALAALLPTVMCAAGGLLYLPAGPMGRRLAAWDLTQPPPPPPAHANHAVSPTATAATSANASMHSAAPDAVRERLRGLLSAAPEAAAAAARPLWQSAGRHTGRLLAAAADGALAVSGCDGGVLCFWRGREAGGGPAGSADISRLTSLPVVPARPGDTRHLLRLSVCAPSGLAAAMLASPLAPEVLLFRAAAPPHAGHGPTAATHGSSCAARDSDGGRGGSGSSVVGQLLRRIATSASDGLALYRGHLIAMGAQTNDVMGARFHGGGGSSIRLTAHVSLWPLPAALLSAEGASGGAGGAAAQERGEEGSGCDGGVSASDPAWPAPVRLFSTRLHLEHPRTLVQGRLRPLLAPCEDLLLAALPRNVGGRPPHHTLCGLEHAMGAGEEEEGPGEGQRQRQGREWRGAAGARGGGGGGGGGGFVVVSEDDRLPWVEVVEDATDVITAVVAAPHHLALLTEGGRVRLYDIC